jgi:hypothetical protein
MTDVAALPTPPGSESQTVLRPCLNCCSVLHAFMVQTDSHLDPNTSTVCKVLCLSAALVRCHAFRCAVIRHNSCPSAERGDCMQPGQRCMRAALRSCYNWTALPRQTLTDSRAVPDRSTGHCPYKQPDFHLYPVCMRSQLDATRYIRATISAVTVTTSISWLQDLIWLECALNVLY